MVGVELRAPFPYFGGKSRIATLIWERFGAVDNYVEPFCGSAAVLLARPDVHRWWDRTETVNDADGFIVNFWRATQADPEAVAHWADWPVMECDKHARHAWLLSQRDSLVPRLEGDPHYYDAKVAGWWVWGLSVLIGAGWCTGRGPWSVQDGQLVHLSDAGQGIQRGLVHLSDAGQGVHRKLIHLEDAGQGHCAAWSEHLRIIMARLSDRLRRVRVCCGDWSRVCGPTPTVKLGTTGVFLDPPYSEAADRKMGMYRLDDGEVAAEVRRWAIARGDDPRMRIALCGYDGEHDMPSTWSVTRWKGHGGYGVQGEGRGRANAKRECIWWSPHCLPERQPSLFDWEGSV